jgi:simple sugar transport system permease protein
MIGSNPRFSKYVGIAFMSRQVLAMGISGALAGLGGAIEVLGSQHRFIQDISPGWGFDGILVALLAGLNPLAVIPVGLLFGALKGGGLGMEAATNVPSELSQVLLSIIVLLVAAQIGIATLFSWIKQRQTSSGESPEKSAVEESGLVAR